MIQMISLYIIGSVSIINLFIGILIVKSLRVIEVTKEITIIKKPEIEKPFTPVLVKAKTGVWNHIINEMKNDHTKSWIKG